MRDYLFSTLKGNGTRNVLWSYKNLLQGCFLFLRDDNGWCKDVVISALWKNEHLDKKLRCFQNRQFLSVVVLSNILWNQKSLMKKLWENFQKYQFDLCFPLFTQYLGFGDFFWDHWLSSLYHWKEVERDTILYFYKKKSAKSKLSVYERGSLEERVQSNSATNWQSHDSQSVW